MEPASRVSSAVGHFVLMTLISSSWRRLIVLCDRSGLELIVLEESGTVIRLLGCLMEVCKYVDVEN